MPSLWWGCHSGFVRALWSRSKSKSLQLAVLPWCLAGGQSSFAERESEGELQYNNDEFWKSKVSDARPFSKVTAGYWALPCNTCPNCFLWKRQLLSEQSNERLSVNTWCCYCWYTDANLLKWCITAPADFNFCLAYSRWVDWLIDWLAGWLIVWYLYIAKKPKRKAKTEESHY